MRTLLRRYLMISWITLGGLIPAYSQPGQGPIPPLDSLLRHAIELAQEGKFNEAAKAHSSADSLLQASPPADSLDWAKLFHNKGVILLYQHRFAESEIEVRKSRQVLIRQGETQNSFFAQLTNELANLLSRTNRHQEAIPFFREALELLRADLGPDHPYVSFVLHDLAASLWRSGDLQLADSLLAETIRIQKAAFGTMDMYYAVSLLNRAILLKDLGYYESAEPLYLQAIDIQDSLLADDSPRVAVGFSNLAVLYHRWGKYDKAEPYFLLAQEILENHPDGPQPDLGLILNNLGSLYAAIGQEDKSTDCLERSYQLTKQLYGESHPLTLTSHNNLALSYYNRLELDLADSLLAQALRIADAAEVPHTRTQSILLESRGKVHTKAGRYRLAKQAFHQSLELRREYLPPGHPDIASVLRGLGILLYDTGHDTAADSAFRQALQILQETTGINHHLYIQTLSNLGMVQRRSGQIEEAIATLTEVNRLDRRSQTRATRYLSEAELEKYLTLFSARRNSLVSFVGEHPAYPQLTALAYDNALFHKGFLLHFTTTLQGLAKRHPESRSLINDLKACHRRLAAEYSREQPDSILLEKWQTEAHHLEKNLVRQVQGYQSSARQVSWQEVRDHLQPGQAALEFIRYTSSPDTGRKVVHYAALLLSGTDTTPRWIPLCTEDALTALFPTQGGRRADYVNDLYTYRDRGLHPDQSATSSLYNLVWEPVQKHLTEDVREVIYAPTGYLHRINLGAIPTSRSTVVMDQVQMTVVNSTRSLVELLPADREHLGHTAELYGGIHFTAGESTPEDPVADRGTHTEIQREARPWPALPWTEDETRTILHQLTTAGIPTQLRTGSQATESMFKSIGTELVDPPRILHLATHGYFFPDPDHDRSESPVLTRAFQSSRHPMIRSGLILADGNYAWQHGEPRQEGAEDGILTAYEISQMDLSGTELVVLSACETGLGDIRGNEGVYGLQRAFRIAGARHLIMSLWQVPDRETMAFMTTFYQHWLRDGMDIPAAFYRTQLEMRDRFFNPYAWAGFVLVR